MKFTKEDKVCNLLVPLLEKINWSVRHHGCDHYGIYNHKGESTPFTIWKDRIELEKQDFPGYALTFYPTKRNIKFYEKENFIAVGTKSLHLLFMNHDMKRNKNETI